MQIYSFLCCDIAYTTTTENSYEFPLCEDEEISHAICLICRKCLFCNVYRNPRVHSIKHAQIENNTNKINNLNLRVLETTKNLITDRISEGLDLFTSTLLELDYQFAIDEIRKLPMPPEASVPVKLDRDEIQIVALEQPLMDSSPKKPNGFSSRCCVIV